MDIIEFPKYYKQCPKCGSLRIVFVQQDMISYKRIYNINQNGNVMPDSYRTISLFKENMPPFYACENCEWVDFGGHTWNKKDKVTAIDDQSQKATKHK